MNVTLELKWQMATKTHKYEIPKAPVMCNILLTSSVIIRWASALRVLSVSSIIYQASASTFRTQLYPCIFLSIFNVSIHYLTIYVSTFLYTRYIICRYYYHFMVFYGIVMYCLIISSQQRLRTCSWSMAASDSTLPPAMRQVSYATAFCWGRMHKSLRLATNITHCCSAMFVS